MLQLATDPHASRLNWRPATERKEPTVARAGRPGHAWPFISRHGERPAGQPAAKPTPTSESGS